MEDFNSKYSGQQVEDLLDQVANGNVGGGGVKVYHFDMLLAIQLGAIGQEVYDAIMDADIVFFTSEDNSVILSKYPYPNGDIKLVASSVETDTDDPQRLMAAAIVCTIGADLSVTSAMSSGLIPTKTSELTNDSEFITAADLPPSGGMPTEVIELSSEVTLQEGKMLEIGLTTLLTGSLSLRPPTIEDPTQGLLFGIRFSCGNPVPQLTFAGRLVLCVWANGEFPQLEPNTTVEIIGVYSYDGYPFMSWAKYK